MEQRNKIALVTGGSRGLGKNMALKLAEKGLDVIITYNTQKADALAVADQVKQAGCKAAVLQLNTGNVKSFTPFFEELKAILADTFEAERFDFLINNAGIGSNAPFTDVTEAAFDELMNVHYKGVFFLTQGALPLMRDGGGIINVSSGLARFTMNGYSAYASMKGAIEVLTRYLAKELGPRGIKANIIAPGAIETDFSGGMVRDNEQINKHIAGLTALGRVGRPDDIGGVAAFLCTDDARWITGQRIEISGGMNL